MHVLLCTTMYCALGHFQYTQQLALKKATHYNDTEHFCWLTSHQRDLSSRSFGSQQASGILQTPEQTQALHLLNLDFFSRPCRLIREYIKVIQMGIYYIEYVYLRPYIYSFCQIFQALRLFTALRFFRRLETLITLQGINIRHGKFSKKNKCRALNTHILCSKYPSK